jgi:hypothetical protein
MRLDSGKENLRASSLGFKKVRDVYSIHWKYRFPGRRYDVPDESYGFGSPGTTNTIGC